MNTEQVPDRITGTATSTLPAGMTQAEADRLIAANTPTSKEEPR